VSDLRVYVAGASSEMERAERYMAKLREAGVTVTSTWPEVIRSQPNGEANPMSVPRAVRARWARTDLDEVSSSNFLWLLVPKVPSAGAHVEFGYAAMLMRSFDMAEAVGIDDAVPAFELLCSGKETSIFTALSPNHFDTDDEAFGFLLALHQFLEANPRPDDSIDHAFPEHPYPEGDDDFGPFDDEEGEDEGEPDNVATVLERQVSAIFKKPSP
jgi:hypothetical protein